METSTVHPFLTGRTLKKHEITTKSKLQLLFFFFVGAGHNRSFDRSAATHSSKPPSTATQIEEQTPKERLQKIRGSSPSAVGTTNLEHPHATSCPAAVDRRTNNAKELANETSKDKGRRTKTIADTDWR